MIPQEPCQKHVNLILKSLETHPLINFGMANMGNFGKKRRYNVKKPCKFKFNNPIIYILHNQKNDILYTE
jgi:hypothetical protein